MKQVQKYDKSNSKIKQLSDKIHVQTLGAELLLFTYAQLSFKSPVIKRNVYLRQIKDNTA